MGVASNGMNDNYNNDNDNGDNINSKRKLIGRLWIWKNC